MWAKPYRDHTKIKIINIYKIYLTFIFGYPETLYLNNGFYFINRDVQRLFREYKIIYFIDFISHPFLINLIKRAVQGIFSFLRTKYI